MLGAPAFWMGIPVGSFLNVVVSLLAGCSLAQQIRRRQVPMYRDLSWLWEVPQSKQHMGRAGENVDTCLLDYFLCKAGGDYIAERNVRLAGGLAL